LLVSHNVRVSVRFFTTLRELTGKKEEILKFSEGRIVTVDSVLKRLVTLHGKSFADYVYDKKTREVRGFLQFLVNGRSTSSSGGLDTKLSDGDVLAIIPPVGGG
jgi:molybdopterin synthase sulfur carrier subunit